MLAAQQIPQREDNKMAKVLSGKRLMIAKDNKTMFIIVAATGVVLGVCIVGIFRLSKIIGFNARVIGAKQDTVATIESNTKAIKSIRDQLMTLSTTSDTTLKPLIVTEDVIVGNNNIPGGTSSSDVLYGPTLRVIADALPAYSNMCDTNIDNTLRTSMSLKLLGPAVEALSVGDDSNSYCGVGAGGVDAGTSTSSTTTATDVLHAIPFSFSISFSNPADGAESETNPSAMGRIQSILENLEKSIRTIQVADTRITRSEGGAEMRVTGEAYWTDIYTLPADAKSLTTKTERMSGGGTRK